MYCISNTIKADVNAESEDTHNIGRHQVLTKNITRDESGTKFRVRWISAMVYYLWAILEICHKPILTCVAEDSDY